jgi:hypothetical protein
MRGGAGGGGADVRPLCLGLGTQRWNTFSPALGTPQFYKYRPQLGYHQVALDIDLDRALSIRVRRGLYKD